MMDALSHFHILRPWWLLLVLPGFFLWWLERRETDTTARWRGVMDAGLLSALTVGGDHRRIGPADLLLALWLLGIVAVAGPTWREVPSPFAQSARPAVFVLRVTPSMLGRDLAPPPVQGEASRWEEAGWWLTPILALLLLLWFRRGWVLA